jgi:pimeloyl-ACP methyl ester carboxylesterase
METFIQLLFILLTTSYHILASWHENKQKPPGELLDIGGYKLHLYSKGEGKATVIFDHSLGGIDGYFLVEDLAKIARVCIYDRAGYGWSEPSPKSRCSETIVNELHALLSEAKIEPPYILVGDSFGSYNVRLYAHHFPDRVVGLVLTDGLHEEAMLDMSFELQLLKLLFLSGFLTSSVAASLGIIRILGDLGVFELIKKELKQFPQETLQPVKRSFYSHNHWLTMAREIWNIDKSSRQVRQANDLGNIPIVSIKASTFLHRNFLNFYMPLEQADRLCDRMHAELLKLSTNVTQIKSDRSSHFVWIDEPETILAAVQKILQQLN